LQRARRLASWAGSFADRVAPSAPAWRGAAWALLAVTTLLLGLRLAFASAGFAAVVAVLLGVPLELLVATIGAGLLVLVHRLMSALPGLYRFGLAGTLFALLTHVFTGSLTEKLVPTVYVALATSLVGGGLMSAWARWRVERRLSRPVLARLGAFAGGAVALALAVGWLLSEGEDQAPVINAAEATRAAVAPLALPDPGAPGPFEVRHLTYGSGRDLRRPEYGKGAALLTHPIDGSPFIRGWRGFDGWARTRYWGFGPKEMPLDAHVHYPAGEGPFPLVLIAHGNHRMQEFSEPGYAYLARNLASHGYIVASVDENFLNGAPWNDLAVFGLETLGNDNAARGVILLEHLKVFRAWNGAPGNPFCGLVDMSRIALIGHSRGGEAIAAAAAFNRLTLYPDDASVRFDYGFDIRALVAISTTDRQYQPGGTGIALSDVSFLALQGTNDGDVPYFMGMQQFERLKLEPSSDAFKAAVYIHRANHSQFNTVWGRTDKSVWPRRLFFNRRPILAAADQRKIANVHVTAFLKATLQGERGYLPLFQDYRAGAAWLPDTIYLNRYRDGKVQLVAAYGEDVDLTTTTIPGGHIRGERLTVWREHPPGQPALWEALGTRSAHLGWDRRRSGDVASYAISLPPSLPALHAGSQLFLALADAREGLPASARRAPVDLTIELRDAAGAVARLPLSHVSHLQPRLESRVWKGWFAPREPPVHAVFRTFIFPLSGFVAASPGFDPARLTEVRLVFDRTPVGLVVLDNVGLRP
jgi:dienelactone hydrolase